MGTMNFDDFTDLENREKEEEQDALDTVVPPADIVAFTEQRSCADLYRKKNSPGSPQKTFGAD